MANHLAADCAQQVVCSTCGKEHHMAFERGNTVDKLEVTGKTKATGTKVMFRPDPKIFTELRFDYATVANRLRELAYLIGTNQVMVLP